MSIPTRPLHCSLVVASLALLVAGVMTSLIPTLDSGLHALYARSFARPSRSHSVVLVAVDEPTRLAWGDPPWAPALREELAAELERGGPRLVIWPPGQEPEDRSPAAAMGIDPIVGPTLLRAEEPSFPARALAQLGVARRAGPLPVRFATRLPTVPARRVLAGEIPASAFQGRVVVIGRSDAAAATVATPLGPMSPAQVEAQALLGLLDGARWQVVPTWLRLLALGLWALAVAWAAWQRATIEALGLGVLACGGALLLDAALFAAGITRLGAGAALVVALVAAGSAAAAAHWQARIARRVAARRPVLRRGARLTTTAVDFHKVSET